jgi:hypothetical protein
MSCSGEWSAVYDDAPLLRGILPITIDVDAKTVTYEGVVWRIEPLPDNNLIWAERAIGTNSITGTPYLMYMKIDRVTGVIHIDRAINISGILPWRPTFDGTCKPT